SMLEDQNPHVRDWGAFLALEIDPPKAERVLEEISRNYGRSLGCSAHFTLEYWRKGKLRTLSQWGCRDESKKAVTLTAGASKDRYLQYPVPLILSPTPFAFLLCDALLPCHWVALYPAAGGSS